MINLFHVEDHIIDTSKYNNLLHDDVVTKLEERFAKYVGAKYACAINSATNAIFLIFNGKRKTVSIPSIIPPVVANAVVNGGNLIQFYDSINWVGHSYILHKFDDYKVIDSAQEVTPNQFKINVDKNDIMIFSFYPTKPIGGSDGGMIVSNDKKKIESYRTTIHNGMINSISSWERNIQFPGWKMYMNSIQAQIVMNNMDIYDYKREKLKYIMNYYNNRLGYNNNSYHLYRITVNDNKKFLSYMKLKDIQCGIHYKPLHLYDAYKSSTLKSKESLIKSEIAGKITASIPFHYKLSEGDLDVICSAIEKY